MTYSFFWPIYSRLEEELLNVVMNVHCDDKQVQVYSMRLADILIRSSVEIETLSKTIYQQTTEVSVPPAELYFDTVCLKSLNELWKLDSKMIVVSGLDFHFTTKTNKELKPLHKSDKRGTSGAKWKQAYQAVKHDRANSLHLATIKNCIDALGALYILNVYLNDSVYELGNDSKGANFDSSLGSKIFSVKFHTYQDSSEEVYKKGPEFDECIYLLNLNDVTATKLFRAQREIADTEKEFISKAVHKRLPEELMKIPPQDLSIENAESFINAQIKKIAEEEVGNVEHLSRSIKPSHHKIFKNILHKAELNKHQY